MKRLNTWITVITLALVSAKPVHAQHADVHWLRCISQPTNVPLDRSMKFTSATVAPLMIAVPVGLLAYEHFRTDGNISKPVVIVATLAASSAITFGLKYTVQRPRPFVTYPDIVKKGTGGPMSFPSGHTSTAFALATSLSLEYPQWYVIAPSYLWACSVGYSRMRLGMHYPSDVATGAVIGAGCAWASWWINKKIQVEKEKLNKERIWP